MRFLLCPVVLLATAFCNEPGMTQKEWSVQDTAGPVREFSGFFLDCQGINLSSISGSLTLDYDPLRLQMDVLEGQVSSVLCADMDEDGDKDIVACEFRGRILLYENTGTGQSFLVHTVFQPEAFGPERIVSADMDGDGDADLVGTSRGDMSISWWENTGTDPWTRHVLNPGEGNPFPLDAGDMDGDGDQDILLGLNSPGRLIWMENPEWTVHEVDIDLPDLYVVEVLPGGEGLLATSFGDSVVCVYNRSEDGWIRTLSVSVRGPLWAACEDMDGDGVEDLIGCSSWDDILFWQPLTGFETERVVISHSMIAPCHFSIADLDGDGDYDVLAVSRAAGEIVWWENTDNGSRFFEHYAAAIPGCCCCAAGDLNGDSRPDAVVGSITDGSLSWLTLGDYADHGNLTSSILYIGPDPDNVEVEWHGTVPVGTSVRLFTRVSADRTRMGEWMEAVENPAEITMGLTPYTRFIQYRIELFTEDKSLSPRVDSVSVQVSPAFSF